MKPSFQWSKGTEAIARDKLKGNDGLLFLANECKKLMEPYVPANNMALSQNTRVYTEDKCGVVEYNSPYAHYQYTGVLYVSSKTGSSWSKGEYKVPTGKALNYSKFRHPQATKKWDEAMKVAKMKDLEKSFQNYIKG